MRLAGVLTVWVGVLAALALWLIPTHVSYPYTDLGEGGIAHSRWCGAPLTHALGYHNETAQVGWNHSTGNPDFVACMRKSLAHTVAGGGVLVIGSLGGIWMRSNARRRSLPRLTA